MGLSNAEKMNGMYIRTVSTLHLPKVITGVNFTIFYEQILCQKVYAELTGVRPERKV